MASIRSKIGKPIKAKTVTVDHEGETYTLSGMPNPSAILAGYDEDLNSKLCDLWNVRYCPVSEDGTLISPVPVTFDQDTVPQIRIVHAYLKPDEGENPYDISEVAGLYAADGVLFMKLLAGATKIMNQKGMGVIEIAGGKSTAEGQAVN